jgi:hypothetical protein
VSVSYEDAQDLLAELKTRHERRHWELAALRRYWQGHYWDDSTNRAGVSTVSQLFRDLKANQADVGPDLKLVHNLLQEICVKYQTFLSPVPMIRTFRDPPFSENRRKQATLKERVLYGTWWMNKMSRRMGEIAWYLPLMGDCFVGVWPDYDQKLVRMIVRSPENAHPVRSMNYDCLDAIMFRSEMTERQVMRAYPNYRPAQQQSRGRFRPFPKAMGASAARKVEFIEYSSESEYVAWGGDQELRRIPHNFGFNLFTQMGFIPVPGEDFNHGAVEQIVSMVEMGNAGYSLMFQAMLENVFPTMVITDPAKAPAELLRGPGSTIPLNPGGKVEYLTPPAQALGIQMAFLRENADKVLEQAAMPRVSLGQSPATSIVTGAAVNELQGAGSGSTVEMVQGTEIGPGLSAWNEQALFIYANEFKDDSIPMYAIERATGMELNGRGTAAAFNFKGSEIVGSYRNEVVFSPHMNDHERLVMNLQALGANLVSKAHVREQMGVADNDEMVEQIFTEIVEEGLIGAAVAAFTQAPTEQSAQQAERQITGIVDMTPNAQPHPLLSMGQTPPALPQAPAGPPPGGAAPGPAAGSAPLAPAGSPPPPGPQGGPAILDQVKADVQAVQGIQGRVWLVGEIVQQGQTAGPIEMAVNDPADQQVLTQGLPQYQLNIKVITGEPQEASVEVTPGVSTPAGPPAPVPVPA